MTGRQIGRAAKAVAAGAVTFAGGMATASVDGVTQPELWGVIATTVASAAAVYQVRNSRPRPDA